MIGLFEAINREGLLFSARTFLAAMSALWIALEFDLPRPYWAPVTVYVLAQPLASAVTSKAVYRFFGTLVGGAAAVALVPNLVNAPELLCLGLSFWIGFCLFLSRLDRTPRSYAFMLAGYTAAIIGFPSVDAPGQIFDTAISRVEEIVVGIACATVASHAIFPGHIGPLIAARIGSWFDDAGDLARYVLSGAPDIELTHRDQRRLADAISSIATLTSQLPYDTSALRQASGRMSVLQQRMTALLPLLAGIGDRLRALDECGEINHELQSLCVDLAAWIKNDVRGETDAELMRTRIQTAVEKFFSEDAEETWRWPDLLTSSLLARLQDFADLWADCLDLRKDLVEGKNDSADRFRAALRYAGISGLHLDFTAAFQSGLSAVVAIWLCCAFWIASAWSDGAGAAVICAVFSSIYASLDNPVAALRSSTLFLLLATIIAFSYEFYVFPAIDGFPPLVLSIAPMLLFFGALLPTPSWGRIGNIMCVFGTLSMGVQARLNLDLVDFVNGNIATLVGAMVATATTAAVGTSIEEIVNRLLRATWKDLADVSGRREAIDIPFFVNRFVDRFSLIVQRVAALPVASEIDPEAVMRELRVGINIVDLQIARNELPAGQQQAVVALLDALHEFFNSSRLSEDDEKRASLRPFVDKAIASFADRQNCTPAYLTCLHALVGIRRALLPNAPDFTGIPPLTKVESAV